MRMTTGAGMQHACRFGAAFAFSAPMNLCRDPKTRPAPAVAGPSPDGRAPFTGTGQPPVPSTTRRLMA